MIDPANQAPFQEFVTSPLPTPLGVEQKFRVYVLACIGLLNFDSIGVGVTGAPRPWPFYATVYLRWKRYEAFAEWLPPHSNIDTRPHPQAGAVCVCGRKPARADTRNFAPRDGRGERGGYGLLKERLISWVDPHFFFCAGLL